MKHKLSNQKWSTSKRGKPNLLVPWITHNMFSWYSKSSMIVIDFNSIFDECHSPVSISRWVPALALEPVLSVSLQKIQDWFSWVKMEYLTTGSKLFGSFVLIKNLGEFLKTLIWSKMSAALQDKAPFMEQFVEESLPMTMTLTLQMTLSSTSSELSSIPSSLALMHWNKTTTFSTCNKPVSRNF